ncbi:MAG TPA: hypothetical protein DCS82_11460 [Rhodospirillaceae bacterium]|nr:hypothetical protein [Rhodospirillaceae bacterium]HAA94017.1 hypothetical protein [Rhodospirillaceae bacterium]HAT36327.1 hypothetical protein [Rhodospirillaceae bacterium]
MERFHYNRASMIPDQNRTTEFLFPTLIQVTEHPDAQAFNARLMAEIETIRKTVPNGKPGNWSCDHYTTMTNEGRLHQRPGFEEFADFAMACAQHYGDIMRYHYGDKELQLNDCWLNIYGAGHSQDIHNHPNHVLSGVYFVKVPEGAASLLFYSPHYKTMIRPAISEETPVNCMDMPYPPAAGDFVLFESATKHSVPFNEVEGDRITLAVNFSLERSLGS